VTTFGLVHGAWHGAWCWAALERELAARGHAAVAVDLPCDDPDAMFEDYAEAVVAGLAGQGEDVVLVGHSLGGLTIPLVAVARPVRRLVYLCALVAQPGASFSDQMRAEPDIFVAGYEAGIGPPDDRRRTRWVDYGIALETMYPDCTDAVAAAAFERLRPQAAGVYRHPCPLDAQPDVPTAYVVATEDRIVNPAWSRRAAVERLRVEPVELPGGHSPYLARPAALADLLEDQASRAT
jgi:pimeloyl-ACP methyl ester carboxylesterase